jgi:MFS family permease
VIGAQTTVTNTSRAADRDRQIGTYYVATALGQAVGPIVAGLLIGGVHDTAGGARVLLLGSLSSFIVAALSTTFPRHSGAGRHGDSAEGRTPILEMLTRSGMRQAILSSIVLLTALDLIVAYLPVYGVDRGIPPQTIGLAIGALGLSQMVSRLAIARLTQRVGYTAVLLASMAVPAALVVLLVAPVSDPVLIGIMALIGLALGLGQPLTLILVALASNRRSRGQAMSLRMVGNRLGQLVLPVTVGATAGQAGVNGILVAVAVMLGLGTLAIGLDKPDVHEEMPVEILEEIPDAIAEG